MKSYADAEGRVTNFTRRWDGQLSAITFPGGERAEIEYDEAGRMAAVTDTAGRRTAYAYDALHR
ncbi:MAG: RHS repeat domain-containing protein, partial [Chloroflexota bacterium]